MEETYMTEQEYRNAFEAGKATGKPKWIPVEERLPDIYETVLVSVLSVNGYGEPATYETLGNYDKGWELYFPLHEGERVIYWMQMPEPPTAY